jgi:hypothetical protein
MHSFQAMSRSMARCSECESFAHDARNFDALLPAPPNPIVSAAATAHDENGSRGNVHRIASVLRRN